MDIQHFEGLGRLPVSANQPAGADVRDDPRFEALQAEIAKLSTPGAGAIDWTNVAQLGAVLLSEKGKDLLVASYLGGALVQLAQLDGLCVGLENLADLVEHHWEQMTPPVTRLRARRNAVQWLLDRLDVAMQDPRWDNPTPVPASQMQALLQHTSRLDQQLRDRDEDAPSLRPLRQWLDRLPVQEPEPEPEPAPAPSAAPASTPHTDAAREELPSTAGGQLHAEAPASRAPAVATSAPARAPAAAAAPALAPMPAPVGDLDAAWEQALEHLNQLADRLMSEDPQDPRAYRTARFANWAGLRELPPASDGRTQIPAPISQVVDAWARISSANGDPMDAVQFAEAQLPAFPFWLDLQYLCAQALERAGYQPALDEVQTATRDLLRRLPGLQALSFANGMPFANGETLTWLASLGDGGGSAGDATHTQRAQAQSPDSRIAQARSLAANGELDAAVGVLQSAIQQSNNASDALLLRTKLCSLLSEHLPGRVPSAFADELLAQVRRHDLAHWAPALASEALAAAYTILREDEHRQADAQSALATLASLDASRVLALIAA